MLCKHHFSKNGQVFFHIFWVVTLIMQSRIQASTEPFTLWVLCQFSRESAVSKGQK
ncbi:hypothetical protein HMPREF0539_0813 [Lacticaseibacillus rhamnosus LMS2-1]|uniref:Uncharacterized protein n=1 Tax=Lacticaseibacillus rhamnosus (strain LMS2-1) TaxID=525361 RepID=C2JV79_LACRM|nr:hypothetical protein HMPREF0539_0813 [Lacticaseibacillus rhamnosus LMS2-1]